MKKICCITILIVLIVSCAACNKTTEKNTPPTPSKAVEKSKNKSDSTLAGFVTNDYHPVIFSDGVFSNAEVLGGSKGGKWFQINDFDIQYNGTEVNTDANEFTTTTQDLVTIDLVNGGETYKFYTKDGYIATANGTKPTMEVNGATLDKYVRVDLEEQIEVPEGIFVIGINGDWNALPRVPKEVSETKWLIDIEGDGSEEILSTSVAKESFEGYEEPLEVVTIKIEAGKKAVFTRKIPLDELTDDYEILIFDLNGDGKLEVIIYVTGYCMSIETYEIGKAEPVMSYYMGD